MSDFLKDLKSYLEGLGFTEIWLDFMPDRPDRCVGVFLAEERPSDTGGCRRLLNVRVRSPSAKDAANRARELMEALDSGPDEEILCLADWRRVVCRPGRGPVKLKSDDAGRVTYGFEAAVFE